MIGGWWDGRLNQSRRVKTKLHAHTKPSQAILVRLVCCLDDATVRRQGLDQIRFNRRRSTLAGPWPFGLVGRLLESVAPTCMPRAEPAPKWSYNP